MKSIITLFSLLVLTLSISAQDLKGTVTNAFRSGNSKALAEHFTSSLDLAVNDQDDVYSKAQSEQILKKFFSKNQPSSFKVLYEGESRNGIKYFIGELETSGGKFRVTINMKEVSGIVRIYQLRIE